MVNNSPSVNEKDVLEKMLITLQCWVELESLSLKSFSKHSFAPVIRFHATEGRESTLT